MNPEDLPCFGRPADFVFNTSQGGLVGWRRSKIATAKAMCDSCPIKQRCLDLELSRMAGGVATYGVYGGTTQAERSRMVTFRNLRPIAHGTHRGYVMEIARKLSTCAECRAAHARYKRGTNAPSDPQDEHGSVAS